MLGHARKVEGSVRKKTNARKEQRKSKEERMAIKQKEREEELKRLKNLKKQEIQKVKKIMKTAGIHDDDIIPLSMAKIEEEFDPEEYDRMMKKAFDEKYYNAEDADPDFCSDMMTMRSQIFKKEDELLGLPKGWDACRSNINRDNLSRKAKRRQQVANLKLSQSTSV